MENKPEKREEEKAQNPWYKEGLSFKCTGCGQCCTGSPGYVWLSPEEIKAMASHLNITEEEFTRKYTRYVYGRISLLEHPKTYDCVFLKGNKCSVYPVRPKQCKTFPWWHENLENKASWEETAQRCEGINHPEAPIVPLETISQELSKN